MRITLIAQQTIGRLDTAYDSLEAACPWPACGKYECTRAAVTRLEGWDFKLFVLLRGSIRRRKDRRVLPDARDHLSRALTTLPSKLPSDHGAVPPRPPLNVLHMRLLRQCLSTARSSRLSLTRQADTHSLRCRSCSCGDTMARLQHEIVSTAPYTVLALATQLRVTYNEYVTKRSSSRSREHAAAAVDRGSGHGSPLSGPAPQVVGKLKGYGCAACWRS